MLRSSLRQPALHFLLLGGLLFLAQEQLGAPKASIFISASRVAELRGDFARQHGRTATPDEERRLLKQLTREQLLLQEARRLGLDRGDLVISRRLVEKMRLLADDPELSVAALYRQALDLGLDRDDPIVRQRLLQRMTFRLQAEDGPVRATPAEIEAYYARHRDRFLESERIRLTHVFLSGSPRDEGLAAAARRELAQLRRDGVPPEEGPSRGDAFLLGHHLPLRDRAGLVRSFGEPFAEQAFAFEPGGWGGVAESPYGLHLLWVHERHPASPATLEAVRDKVLQGIAENRRRERLDSAVARLRARCRVRIELPEVG